VGVIPDPEIIEYEVTPDDIYMVIASDGVWEFLSNDKVAEIT
jgi:serine/threonine protein phosphatase PrpC